MPFDFDAIAVELRRRQGGYGRGRRMVIESDRAEVLSGVRRGRTTGAPLAMLIRNKDWENWQNTMHVEPTAPPGSTGANRAAVVRPRPGHGRPFRAEHLDRRAGRQVAAQGYQAAA